VGPTTICASSAGLPLALDLMAAHESSTDSRRPTFFVGPDSTAIVWPENEATMALRGVVTAAVSAPLQLMSMDAAARAAPITATQGAPHGPD